MEKNLDSKGRWRNKIVAFRVSPGEMEQIKLTKEQLMKYPGLKTITVKIEEA